jgi:hypothetical protein
VLELESGLASAVVVESTLVSSLESRTPPEVESGLSPAVESGAESGSVRSVLFASEEPRASAREPAAASSEEESLAPASGKA